MALTRTQLKQEIRRILNSGSPTMGAEIKDLLRDQFGMEDTEAMSYARRFLDEHTTEPPEFLMRELSSRLYEGYGHDMSGQAGLPWYKRLAKRAQNLREADADRTAVNFTRGQEQRQQKIAERAERRGIDPSEYVGSGARIWFFLLVFGIAICIFFAIKSQEFWYATVFLMLLLLVQFAFSDPLRKEFGKGMGTIAILSLWLHAFIAGNGFTLNRFTIIALITFFVVVAIIYIMAIVFSFQHDDPAGMLLSLLGWLIGMLAFYALPWALGRAFGIGSDTQNYVILIVTLLPLWSLYLFHQVREQNPGGYASGFLGLYIGIVSIIALFMILPLLWGIAPKLPNFNTAVDAQTGVQEATKTAKDKFMDGVKKLIGIYDVSTNPDAYYTSQVEKNKKAPLGVTIATFRSQDRIIDNESEVIVHGVAKAQSFIGSTVTIEPACIIDRKGAPSGSVDPVITEIVYGSSQGFTCTFPPLATGTYSVIGSVTFPFETWAYISYTFVDDERARNFAKQGLDVKQELGIAEEPVAIFTSGPVKVGMGGSTMPILVKPEGPQLLQSGTRIGITIDPAWESGELQRVERIELKVPRPFLLGKCDRNQTQEPQQDLLDPEYTTYVFQNPSHGPITTHTSLTCSLNITDAAAAAELVKGQDKSIRSFVAVVKYRYAVEQKTTVQVR